MFFLNLDQTKSTITNHKQAQRWRLGRQKGWVGELGWQRGEWRWGNRKLGTVRRSATWDGEAIDDRWLRTVRRSAGWDGEAINGLGRWGDQRSTAWDGEAIGDWWLGTVRWSVAWDGEVIDGERRLTKRGWELERVLGEDESSVTEKERERHGVREKIK